ncbi:MAG: hypothetical protein WD048_03550 [Chitinophagales bacterium]
MKQLTIHIDEKKFPAFLEFIKTLDFVKIDKSKNEFLNDLSEAVEEVKLEKEGKIQLQSAQDFLDEL